jgi:hypothetical protein
MPKVVGGKKIAKLVDSYRKIENELLQIVRELNRTTSDTKAPQYSLITKGVREQYEKFRVVQNKWSKVSIPSTYDQNTRMQVSRIKGLKFTPIKVASSNKINNSKVSNASKRSLTRDFNLTMLRALEGGERTLLQLIRLTQQTNVDEKTIDKLVDEGFTEGASVFSVQKNLQERLMDQALDKKYITIIDKNGDPNQWVTSKYAKMVARTKLSETQALSTVNTATAFGSDLIQISSHNTTSPQCIPFEGKIYSISGKDKKFPKLTELNPFHPNCLHTSSVIFREILEERGIKKYSDFSLGKTEINPTRKSFIPQSDMKKRLENAIASQTSKKKKKVLERRLEKL